MEQKDKETQRSEWRERKQNQRQRDSVFEEEQKRKSLDPAERRVVEIMARINQEDKSKYGPGVPLPKEDPEKLKARSDAFDKEKAECERKTIEGTIRTIWALAHGIPVGWVTLFPEEFPQLQT